MFPSRTTGRRSLIIGLALIGAMFTPLLPNLHPADAASPSSQIEQKSYKFDFDKAGRLTVEGKIADQIPLTPELARELKVNPQQQDLIQVWVYCDEYGCIIIVIQCNCVAGKTPERTVQSVLPERVWSAKVHELTGY